MTIKILAIGDICGQAGLNIVTEKLRDIKKWANISFTVVNGENTAGLGITPNHADALFDCGADVITLGNHAWGISKIVKYLENNKNIIRPANFAPSAPGSGYVICDTEFGRICVINLIGQVDMYYGNDNPFLEVDRLLKKIDANIILVDFHAEATSEKHAMAYYLDGHVTAVWGTHTHVQTSDIRILNSGTGYITDLGMSGAYDSIIGMKSEQPISRFLGNPPLRFEPAEGPSRIEGAIFEVDISTGRCVCVEALRID